MDLLRRRGRRGRRHAARRAGDRQRDGVRARGSALYTQVLKLLRTQVLKLLDALDPEMTGEVDWERLVEGRLRPGAPAGCGPFFLDGRAELRARRLMHGAWFSLLRACRERERGNSAHPGGGGPSSADAADGAAGPAGAGLLPLGTFRECLDAVAPRPRASRPARASRVLSECRVSCLASRAPPALPPVPPPRANRTACGRPGRFSATRRSPASRAQAGARRRRRGRAGAPRTFSRASRPPPPLPPLVLSGHAASVTPY